MARALLPALRHLAVVAALVVDHRPAAVLQVMEVKAVQEVQAMEEVEAVQEVQAMEEAEAVLEVEAMEEAEAVQEVVAMEEAKAVQAVEAVALSPSPSQSPSAPMAQSPPRPAPQASPAHLQVDSLTATTATPQSPAQAARSVPSQDRLFTTPSPALRLAQHSPLALPTQAEMVQPTQAELVLPSQALANQFLLQAASSLLTPSQAQEHLSPALGLPAEADRLTPAVPASQSLRLAASSQATPSLTPVPVSSLPVPARPILPVQGLRLQALVSPLAVLESQSQFLVPARPTRQVPALLQSTQVELLLHTSTQAELLLPTQAELLLHTQAVPVSQLFRAQARHIHPAPDHLPAQLAALTSTHQRQPRSATPAAQLHTPRAPAQALRPSPAAQPTSEEVAVSTHARGFRMSKFPRSMLSNSG